MSQAAERIETARLAYVAARGTPEESQAKATLRQAIDDSIPEIVCSCGETPHARGCDIVTKTIAARVRVRAEFIASHPPALTVPVATNDDEDPQRLFDVVDVPAFTRAITESNRSVLETALGMRGLALTPKLLGELADELARNSAMIVLAMEIKK